MADELTNKLRGILKVNEDKKPNNFLDKEPAIETKQLSDNSKPELIGDPLDVKLNQKANVLGSDGKNSPVVSVEAGAESTSEDEHAGQREPIFHEKTKMAENWDISDEQKLKLYIRKYLNESFIKHPFGHTL